MKNILKKKKTLISILAITCILSFIFGHQQLPVIIVFVGVIFLSQYALFLVAFEKWVKFQKPLMIGVVVIIIGLVADIPATTLITTHQKYNLYNNFSLQYNDSKVVLYFNNLIPEISFNIVTFCFFVFEYIICVAILYSYFFQYSKAVKTLYKDIRKISKVNFNKHHMLVGKYKKISKDNLLEVSTNILKNTGEILAFDQYQVPLRPALFKLCNKYSPDSVAGSNELKKNIVLVYGEAGSGKSVALSTLALDLLNWKNNIKTGWQPRLPVFVSLADLIDSYDNSIEDKKMRNNIFEIAKRDLVESKIETLKILHNSGKIVYLFDGLDELTNIILEDNINGKTKEVESKISRILETLCKAVDKNIAVITTRPFEFTLNKTYLHQVFEVKHISRKGLRKVYPTIQSSNYFIQLLRLPFIFGLHFRNTSSAIKSTDKLPFYMILQRKIKLNPSNPVEIDTQYDLIESYIGQIDLRNINSDFYVKDTRKEILDDLAHEVLDYYLTKKTRFQFLDKEDYKSDTESGSDINKKFLIEKLAESENSVFKKIKRGKKQYFEFYHSLFEDYFICRAINNRIFTESEERNNEVKKQSNLLKYLEVNKIISKSKAAPSPLEVIKNPTLSSLFSMYLSQDEIQRELFFEQCNDFIGIAGNKDKYDLMNYIVEHFSHQINGAIEVAASDASMNPYLKFVKQANQYVAGQFAQDFRRAGHVYKVLILAIKLYPYCEVGVRRDIWKNVFTQNADWLKALMLDMLIDNNLDIKDVFDSQEILVQQNDFLRPIVKSYFLTQYLPILYANRSYYKEIFKTVSELKYFIYLRYLDLRVTWIQYFILFACLFGQATLLFISWRATGGLTTLIISLVKFLGAIIIAGSFKQWVKQCKQPVDVYLAIFGKASEWMTISELINMIVDTKTITSNIHLKKKEHDININPSIGFLRKILIKARKEEGAHPNEFQSFILVFYDWIKVRPSMVYLFSSLILCLWGDYIWDKGMIMSAIVIPTITVIFLIPITSHLFVQNKAKHYLLCSIIFLITLFALLSFFSDIMNSWFLILLLVIFLFVWRLIILPVKETAESAVQNDVDLLKSINNERKDLEKHKEEFNRFRTSRGQRSYLQHNSSFLKHKHLDKNWRCNDPVVYEIFYELGLSFEASSTESE